MAELCDQCPRRCHADRAAGRGFCASPGDFLIARAAPHYGEEPCIGGPRGTGAVFFSGCSLRCVFCQNREISRGQKGEPVSSEGLVRILKELEQQGVSSIDLVTPTHYTRQLAAVLREAALSVPVVWNSSGYENPEELKRLEGLVRVYMPDLKYAQAALAAELSRAPDYPAVALSAIREMYRQTGPFRLGKDGILQQGVLVRHLILPGHIENTLRVLDLVEDELPVNRILFSLMSQYTPLPELAGTPFMKRHPELMRTLTEEEYQRVMDYLDFSSIEEGYVQELSAATEDMLPAFDGTGVAGAALRPE